MSHLINKVILPIQSTTSQIKRFRGKINIQRPRKPHYEKAKVWKFCEPVYEKKKEMSMIELCTKSTEKINLKQLVDNPLEKIYAKECLNWFNHSKMIAFFHMNPITMDETFQVRVALKKENMYLQQYGKAVVKRALTDTKYEAALQLFNSHNMMLFSPEMRVSKMMKIMKKIPQLVLLAGIVEDRLLSRTELVNYSKLPSLDVARSNLTNVLNMAALSLTNNLTCHQRNLVSSLEQYVELQNKSNEPKLSENVQQVNDETSNSSDEQKPA